ncbi:hypothetical protein [Anaeromyxobacter dehalogenans]|nr:hypothetical protein [Anaeromyxobacter dehalogenans]
MEEEARAIVECAMQRFRMAMPRRALNAEDALKLDSAAQRL